jgi:predicted sulfurtransferase
MNTINITAYKFVDLHNPQTLQVQLRENCQKLDIKGTILLSPEGINLMLAGSKRQIDVFKTKLLADERFFDLRFKETLSNTPPFRRLFIKVKPEIIPFGIEGVRPQSFTGARIQPSELKRWLDGGRDFVLLDSRNEFEVRFGTFFKAIDLGIRHFRDFPEAIGRLETSCRNKTLVMFCTGGVRCEKASSLLLKQGFHAVYQLDGGILNYFQSCGGAHWQGECFVFDERISLTPTLEPNCTDSVTHV